MIETGKRDVTYSTGVKLAEKFNKRAERLNMILNIDEGYLMRTPIEDAKIYCFNKLKNDDITEDTIEEIFVIINEYNLLEVKAKTYFKIGQLCDKKKNFEESCINYDKSINIYKSIGKNEKLAYIYMKMGSSNTNNLKYDAAIVYYSLSQNYSFIYDDKGTEKLCLYGLAIAYKKSNKIDLSLQTIEKYLSVASYEDYYYDYALNTKAICYELKSDYDRAIHTYKGLLSKILDNTNPILGYVYNNLGLNYCHKNDFKESMKYFKMAKEIINQQDKSLLSHTIIESSTVLLKQNLHIDAIKAIELGLTYAKKYNDTEYLLKGKHILAEIYDELNDFENLEIVYLEIIELLAPNRDKNSLKSIFNKLALMYLNQDKITLCRKYLLLSKDLN